MVRYVESHEAYKALAQSRISPIIPSYIDGTDAKSEVKTAFRLSWSNEEMIVKTRVSLLMPKYLCKFMDNVNVYIEQLTLI